LCYSQRGAVPSRQLTGTKNDRFNEGVPTDVDNAQGRPCLIILDDLLNDVYSKDVCGLFTKGSHHRNITVILNPQTSFIRGGTIAISH
jgi:hypothetical protein